MIKFEKNEMQVRESDRTRAEEYARTTNVQELINEICRKSGGDITQDNIKWIGVDVQEDEFLKARASAPAGSYNYADVHLLAIYLKRPVHGKCGWQAVVQPDGKLGRLNTIWLTPDKMRSMYGITSFLTVYGDFYAE